MLYIILAQTAQRMVFCCKSCVHLPDISYVNNPHKPHNSLVVGGFLHWDKSQHVRACDEMNKKSNLTHNGHWEHKYNKKTLLICMENVLCS